MGNGGELNISASLGLCHYTHLKIHSGAKEAQKSSTNTQTQPEHNKAIDDGKVEIATSTKCGWSSATDEQCSNVGCCIHESECLYVQIRRGKDIHTHL